jgi:integrase
MPIIPESYPDRDPLLTEEEKALMSSYVERAGYGLPGPQIKVLLSKLSRFDQPYLDTVKLSRDTIVEVAPARRLLFRFMVQTGVAFWAWPEETWTEVIGAFSSKDRSYAGVKFVLINLAYLFCRVLPVSALTTYVLMARVIFGKALVDTQTERLCTPLRNAGYASDSKNETNFRWICALAFLLNRNPFPERLSAAILLDINTLLADLLQERSVRTMKRRRYTLLHLQAVLCELNILDEPVILETKTTLEDVPWLEGDTTIDPRWKAWVDAYTQQTPHLNRRTLFHQRSQLAAAGRWLKKYHPEVTEPGQWTEAIANEYVTYTCNDAHCGELAFPSHKTYIYFQKVPQKLSPASIEHRLTSLKTFFMRLQKRTYLVQGQSQPKLQLTWLPYEALKVPLDVRIARQPNPRDIQEDIWFKLIWAACTLKKEHLQAAHISNYPLAFYRAVCLIWVTAARRSDEIRRLHVGCVRREWAPEMRDEHGQQIEPEEELAYLRVPVNKMKGDFYVPIPLYVADAIEVWESVRPPNQKALIDRKTGKPTTYLFQYRNELMGKAFLNVSAIPLLCNLAGVSQTDVVGRITSHRARATTAIWMRKMGMSPSDIGKLLGHTNPLRSLPWYLREDKHHLGRIYRKANPLDRYVAAILDTNAQAKQEPCVFYYLADSDEGRPRMCGNPHFSRCIHQMMCVECEAFIDHEMAEAIEKRDGAVLISVPVPLPPQMVDEFNEQDEAGSNSTTALETLPPPTLPSPAFHFNKTVPMRSCMSSAEEIDERLQQVEAQIAKKQGKADQRSASLKALLRERAELQARLKEQRREA